MTYEVHYVSFVEQQKDFFAEWLGLCGVRIQESMDYKWASIDELSLFSDEEMCTACALLRLQALAEGEIDARQS